METVGLLENFQMFEILTILCFQKYYFMSQVRILIFVMVTLTMLSRGFLKRI